jgi:hypothetical protein
MGFEKPALTQEFEVYSLSDPCVEVIDETKYVQTLDKKYLKIKSGAAVFTIVPPSTTQQIQAMPCVEKATARDAYEACEYIARACWRGVSGVKIGGKPLELRSENGLLSKETIDQLQDPNLIFELATYARQIGHLPFPVKG